MNPNFISRGSSPHRSTNLRPVTDGQKFEGEVSPHAESWVEPKVLARSNCVWMNCDALENRWKILTDFLEISLGKISTRGYPGEEFS